MSYQQIQAYNAPLPPHPPAVKFTSQDNVHVRTNAQIKFLYYPLLCPVKQCLIWFNLCCLSKILAMS